MKLVLSLVLGFLLTAAAGSLRADDTGATISEAGLFSYQAPPGWTAKDTPMSKFKIAMGEAKDGFAPNLNVVNEDFSGTLAEYVERNKAALKSASVFTTMTFVSEAPFEGAGGAKGVRLVVTDTMGKLNLQQIFYFFDCPKGKLVVTASCLAPTGDQFAPIFDASMKTFSPR